MASPGSFGGTLFLGMMILGTIILSAEATRLGRGLLQQQPTISIPNSNLPPLPSIVNSIPKLSIPPLPSSLPQPQQMPTIPSGIPKPTALPPLPQIPTQTGQLPPLPRIPFPQVPNLQIPSVPIFTPPPPPDSQAKP